MKEEAVETESFKADESNVSDDADEKTDTKIPEFDFSLKFLTTEISAKLQANYEAKILAVKHPEFAKAIAEQLADSKKFQFMLSDSIQTIEIKDIDISSKFSKRNDSITTLAVVYTSVINSKYMQKDSALVVMKNTMVIIDNQVKRNTTFTFERLD
ncbi:hypothetical protein [Kordia jejudonensis]|uniref:hypothetical protein n=1 Tax=Kordia jejudonensis TaxID=1348245 RepID=UPI000629C14C|nr:hypothetical protein [Kordia jejudonensis]